MNRIRRLCKSFIPKLLTCLAAIACLTAQVGANTASAWGGYQPKLPQELDR